MKSLNYTPINFVLVIVLLLGSCFCSSSMATPSTSAGPPDMSTAILIRVDQSGRGDYTKIQDAIDAVPSNNQKLFFIQIEPGIYREKIVVPADKPYITMSGTRPNNTIITWNDGENIFESPTMAVLASEFVGRRLTIQNTYGTTGRGVALRVSGDKVAFYRCRIISYQDTLLDDAGRHYYRNCYIEGATDFVFGNAASIFERCHVHSTSEGDGAIMAQKRESPLQNTGYVFLGGKITGSGGAVLGRPWGSYSRVIYALTYMSEVVQAEGWNDWGDPNKQKTVYYGEYNCYGEGAIRDKRAKWSNSLSDEEAAPFLNKTMIGGRGWLRRTPTHFKSFQKLS